MDLEKLKKSAEILYKLLNIGFKVYSGSAVLISCPENMRSASLIVSGTEPLLALDFDRLILNSAQHETNQYGESFIILNLSGGLTLLLGPYSQEIQREKRLKRLISKLLPKNDLKEHLKNLPYLEAQRAFYLGEIMSLMFYDSKSEEPDEKSKLIKDALEYIRLNLYEKLSAVSIAERLNVHPDYLSSRFKKETGMAMMVHIQRERALVAGVLLKNSQKSVSQIASELQFSSPSRFTEVFKKHIGVSPQSFRDEGTHRGLRQGGKNADMD